VLGLQPQVLPAHPGAGVIELGKNDPLHTQELTGASQDAGRVAADADVAVREEHLRSTTKPG